MLQCKHLFAVKSLSAVVSIRHRRVHLPNWRSIQAGVERMPPQAGP